MLLLMCFGVCAHVSVQVCAKKRERKKNRKKE